MATFFVILFVLIAVNAALLLFSATNSDSKVNKGSAFTDSEAAKIYPLDLDSSKYKKAI